MRRQRKHAAAGLQPHRISSGQAWAILDRMLAREWSSDAIASAAGLSAHTIRNILAERRDGHTRTIGAGVARKLATHSQPTRGHIGAEPARRKVRALTRLGHPQHTIGQAAGLGHTTIAAIRRGDSPRIHPRIAAAIDQAWHALCMTPGTSKKSTATAIAEGWPAPLAYDDIDDPACEPRGMRDGETVRAVAEITELHASGVRLEDIAMRRRISVASVERALQRATEAEEAA
jgi:hypothetical protein